MNTKKKIAIIILIGVLSILVYIEASTPEPVNWFPSYAKTDKIPLGTFVSYSQIKETYTNGGIKDVNQPPYEFLADHDSISGTYFFINGTVNFDKDELSKILLWVEKGNTLFISAQDISNLLLDTLNIKTDHMVALDNMTTQPLVALAHKKLKKKKPYRYDRNTPTMYFKEIDTVNSIVLGYTALYNDTLYIKNKKINYIKQSFGQGKILLHSFPEAFGNYFMLTDKNHEYTQDLLSYIDASKQILWDNYYKSGKISYSSPLFLILNNRYLKWAYYFIIIGVVTFIIFEGKRKQRSIPILTPLKNQTLAFTQTISGMYFEKRKHKEIAVKQNLLFLDYVRQVLRVPTDTLNEKTLQDISARSNASFEDTKALFLYFEELNNKPSIKKEELLQLHRLITQYKSNHKE